MVVNRLSSGHPKSHPPVSAVSEWWSEECGVHDDLNRMPKIESAMGKRIRGSSRCGEEKGKGEGVLLIVLFCFVPAISAAMKYQELHRREMHQRGRFRYSWHSR